jgi:hypothetical protein
MMMMMMMTTTMDSTEPKHLCCTQEAHPLQECRLR